MHRYLSKQKFIFQQSQYYFVVDYNKMEMLTASDNIKPLAGVSAQRPWDSNPSTDMRQSKKSLPKDSGDCKRNEQL